MNVLESVQIEGFWGEKNFTIEFFDDVNFLIGKNGSGKTTVINLIAASLSADFQTLDRIPFSSIRLQLKAVSGNTKPIIEIKKSKARRHAPLEGIEYTIKDKSTGKGQVYSLDSLSEELLLRNYSAHFAQRKMIRFPGLIEHLKTLTSTSWLSIHRSSDEKRTREEKSYDSTVDKKLYELNNDFIRYFSRLDKKISDETARFQENVFLSLLMEEDSSDIIDFSKKLNLEEEKESLVEIFKEFKLKESKYSRRVDKHFKSTDKAMQVVDTKKGFTLDHLVAIMTTWRIHSIIQDWNKVVENKKEIYEPRNNFLNIVNKMMEPKKFSIDENNEILIKTMDGNPIGINNLSSGEKQLLIFLGEALLQENQPHIYIADEPELSLHITWQELLIKNLRALNPKAYILFATHSPDIVGPYQDKIISMEEILR